MYLKAFSTIGKFSKKTVPLEFHNYNMPESSGFFLPDITGSALTDTKGLELIHRSTDGFSELYRGGKDGRFIIYKALKKEYRRNPLYEELLKKDFNIGSSLNHINICQYFGMTELPEIGNCIAMEWIDGRTLESLISEGRITKPLARKIICEICDALDHIHRKQIIHRDLKPENIMITGNGQNVKIIDFGLSDADSYFSFKAPAGTKAYASPELVVGEKIDARSDIWALGVIIKELSGSYRHISSNCLRRDKDKRYHSAAEVKRAIIKEPARKIKNSIAASAVIITIIAGIWMIYEGHGSSIPATDTDIPSADEAEAADTSSLIPAAIPPAATESRTAPETKAAAPKPSPTKTDERLDADALENLFRDAAELIL